jgi:hypothetical protein
VRLVFLVAVSLAIAGFPATAAAQPSCFANPLPKVATVEEGNRERACQILARVLETSASPDSAWIPGQIVNSILNLKQGGFATDTFVLRFRVSDAFSAAFTAGTDELVRFSATSATALTGSWWVPKEYVTDGAGRWLSVEAIKDLLALPQQADLKIVVSSSAIDVGTLGYVGIVAPAFAHPGGGIQFWFPRAPVFSKPAEPFGTF